MSFSVVFRCNQDGLRFRLILISQSLVSSSFHVSSSALFQGYFRTVNPVIIGHEPCGFLEWVKFVLDEQ
jgi:hypothetical protein